MDPLALTRRHFLHNATLGLGALGLSDLLQSPSPARAGGGLASSPLLGRGGKAKRVIYLFQSGGPAAQDLLDPKPLLRQKHGEQLPDFVRRGQRLTGMSSNQASLPLAGSAFNFVRAGKSGIELAETLPWTAKIADELCLVRSMWTEAINHEIGRAHV